MISLRPTNIGRKNYMPTFKRQGQIYHQTVSLLPLPNADYWFLQIYFMENTNQQIDQRCWLSTSTKQEIGIVLYKSRLLFVWQNGKKYSLSYLA